MRLFLIVAALQFAALACGSKPDKPEALEKAESQTKAHSTKLELLDTDVIVPKQMLEGLDGEMIPGQYMTGDRLKGQAGPTEPGELLEDAKNKIAQNNLEDALPILDTLIILDTKNPELFELRSSILKKNGDDIDAADDLQKCCKLGRKTCCL